jgi:hypothetical protein
MLLIVVIFFVLVVMHLEAYELVWYEISYKYLFQLKSYLKCLLQCNIKYCGIIVLCLKYKECELRQWKVGHANDR